MAKSRKPVRKLASKLVKKVTTKRKAAKPARRKAAAPRARAGKAAPREVAAPRAKGSPAKRSASPARAGSGPAKATSGQERRLPDWMQEHLDRYLATNGADGHYWRGVPCLLLTTIGRRSGERRMLPLIYGRDGSRYLVVASKGGAAENPSWYENLVAQPQVELQVGADRFRARARTANRDERPRLWRTMVGIWPAYDQYQARTQREIPVVLIERI